MSGVVFRHGANAGIANARGVSVLQLAASSHDKFYLDSIFSKHNRNLNNNSSSSMVQEDGRKRSKSRGGKKKGRTAEPDLGAPEDHGLNEQVHVTELHVCASRRCGIHSKLILTV